MPTRLLLLLLYISQIVNCTNETDKCDLKATCGECVQKLGCVWCVDPVNQHQTSRCRQENDNLSNWCPSGKLINPHHSAKILKDDSLKSETNGDSVQIKPQSIYLELRKGEQYPLHFQYAQAKNYPVDLYYIMDLSNSMKDHKEKLAKLGQQIAEAMRKITSNFRLGFGSFVDKTDLPFVSTVKHRLEEPCSGCAAPYSFKNHMSLSESWETFSKEVQRAKLSGNLDVPEGGFDALMQAMVCTEEIGWRPQARHLVVFSTDAPYHAAGDGRLAGVVEPHDGKCHMENGNYTHGLILDYPSVSHINYVAKQNNINIIFAVTKKKEDEYKKLSQSIKNSRTGVLSDDSNNVVKLIEDNYNKIVNTVLMTDDSGQDVEINYLSNCPTKVSTACTNVHVGDIINFTAVIKPLRCSSDTKTIKIKPEAINEHLLVELKVLCDCDCEKPPNADYVENAKECSGHGNLQCGVCNCHKGRLGGNCECNGEESVSNAISSCVAPNETAVCSGYGTCKCGNCQCTSDNIVGKYCQCDNNSCKRVKGELCSSRGTCNCGDCECNAGFTGDACQCPDHERDCIALDGDGSVCSNHGACECGKCRCVVDENKYSGKFCEESWQSPHRCEEIRHCVECQAYKTGKFDGETCDLQCTTFNTTIVEKIDENEMEETARICRTLDDGCTMIYYYQSLAEDNELLVFAQRTKVCPEPPNVLAWVLGVVGSIILIGILMLLGWKVVTTIHDRREYEKFENERSKAKWNTSENPLYKSSVSTFRNPAYGLSRLSFRK